MEWTEGQQSAIYARNDTTLVSAAAGSGKTAVLVERVLSLIKEGQDVGRMLIVTFTRAAAAEMRERIQSALQKNATNAHMQQQILRLSHAQISTIHQFCIRVIRDNFNFLDIDPLVTVGDQSLLKALYNKAVEDAMEEAYKSPTQEQTLLFDMYSDTDVQEMVQEMHSFLMSLTHPFEFAKQKTMQYTGKLKDHTAYKVLLREIDVVMDAAKMLLERERHLLSLPRTPQKFEKTLKKDEKLFNNLLENMEKGALGRISLDFARAPTGQLEEGETENASKKYLATREMFKELLIQAVYMLPWGDKWSIEDVHLTNTLTRGLYQITKNMHDKYYALKQHKNWLDYNDLEHLAYKALQDEYIKAQTARKFDNIFVDEYQDVSGIQEGIISAVHQHNLLFLVGDVKQSIYRFRLADPTLFLDKYATFQKYKNAEHRKILLQQNFRSAKNVLASVNHVFRHAMREKVTEIEYDDECALYPSDTALEGASTEIDIFFNRKEDGKYDRVSQGYLAQTKYVISKIKEMVGIQKIQDKGTERFLHYRDIVLLLRDAATQGPEIAKLMQNAGIPVYSDADNQYFEMSEISDMLNILKVLDNPYQDIPLIAMLRIPFFTMSDEELAQIRLTNNSSNVPFYRAFFDMEKDSPLGTKVHIIIDLIKEWQLLSLSLTIEDLVKLLMKDTGIYMQAGAYDEGEIRQANLRLLTDRARNAQESTLHEFLETIESMRMADDAKSAKTLSEQEDVVRIMTMHKSKGLEFPIVFILRTEKAFSKRKDSALYADKDVGFGMMLINTEENTKRHTLLTNAITLQKAREQRAEEARLLYVAMTRAKEKLFVLASPEHFLSSLDKWSLQGELGAGSAGCMFDFVAQSLYKYIETLKSDTYITRRNAVFDIRFMDVKDMPEQSALEKTKQAVLLDTAEQDNYILSMLQREPLSYVPQKTSVSAILKQEKEEKDEYETPVTKQNVSRETNEALPQFLQEKKVTGADRGTLIHKAFGYLPYSAQLTSSSFVYSALETLTKQNVFSEEERALLPSAQIAHFYQTEIGQRALSSNLIKREWAFVMDSESGTVIQGVLDLCFLEEDEWVLVDYKTDNVPSLSDLVSRYEAQMLWYKKALQTLTKRKVKDVYLYSLHLKDFIKI